MHGVLYYSTISGNTALVAEAIQELMTKAGITVTIQDLAEDITWQETDFVILACGTYWHGQLQNMMRKCTEEVWRDIQLKWLPCGAIGLGDHRYDLEYNMYAGDMLMSWLHEHGGNVISPALRINRSPVKLNNGKIIENWTQNFIISLRK
jgi:flavodoxin